MGTTLLTNDLIGKNRWNFLQSSEAINKQEFSESLPRASIQDLGVVLMGAGYEVIYFHILHLFLPFSFLFLSFSFFKFLLFFFLFLWIFNIFNFLVSTISLHILN